MMTETQTPHLHPPGRTRTDFIAVIAATLLILVVVAILLMQSPREQQTVVQNNAMATLRMMTMLDNATDNREQQLLAMLALPMQSKPIYLGIVSPQGQWLQSVGQLPQQSIPYQYPQRPDHWYGERRIEQPSANLIEYYAPVIEHGRLVAFTVAGYPLSEVAGLMVPDSPAALTLMSVILMLPLAWVFLGRRHRSQETDTSVAIPADAQAAGESPQAVETARQDSSPKLRIVRTDTSNVVSSKLLQKQTDRLGAMLEAMPCAIVLLNAQARVEYANQKLYQLFDLQPGTLMGAGLAQWCKHKAIAEVLASEQILQDSKCHHRRFDVSADNRELLLEICPLSAGNQDEKGSVLVLFYENQAGHGEVASSAEFIAHVAHQIKTPLNTIFMYSEVLHSGHLLAEDKRQRASQVIYREAGRMARLLDNLLNISMLKSGSIAPQYRTLETARYLETLVKIIKASEPERCSDIHLHIDDELPALAVDRDLMQVALMQLIENAVYYSEAGTAIDIDIREQGSTLRIDIRDRGIGISTEDQRQMFDMFYRSADDRVRQIKGNGLGLTLAKQIIELHGGSLLCDSKPGAGTVFSVVLGKSTGRLEGVA